MAFFVNCGVSIAGMVTAVPKNKITTDSFECVFGKDTISKFKENTGILEMYHAFKDQTASDLGYAASNYLISKLNISREDIGVCIFVSQAPDYRKPATACVLQHRLGLSMKCAAFDVNMGCSGFIYGHQIMQSFMQTCDEEYGLLIVAESATKQVDCTDKSVAMMFGDAGAAILYKKNSQEDSVVLLKTDGSRFRSLIVPAGGFRDLNPPETTFRDAEGVVRSKFNNYMDGLGVFAFSITDVPIAIREYLGKVGKVISDYDYVFIHQANNMIMKQIARRIKVEFGKVPVSLDRYGNTGGVSIPLTICDFFGDKSAGTLNILTSGFGIGLSVGVTSFKLDTNTVFPIFETEEIYHEGKF